MAGAATPGDLFWAAPHRPLFLAAFFWAVLCIAIWPLGEAFGFYPGLPGRAIRLHAHEMIFGFGGAAVGGCLLTALPSWSARDPLAGAPLIAITDLWATARFAVLAGAPLPASLLSGGYFFTLTAILFPQILTAKSYAKLIFPAVTALLGLSSTAYLPGALVITGMVPLLLMAFLHALIAGRAVPAFTTNWMQLTRREPQPRQCGPSRTAALLLLAAALLLALQKNTAASGALMLAAAAALLITSRGWQSRAAMQDPLLSALHLSWYWLLAGLALLGLARLSGATQLEMHILHAIAIGGLGAKIMGISGRAAAMRTGLLGACHPIRSPALVRGLDGLYPLLQTSPHRPAPQAGVQRTQSLIDRRDPMKLACVTAEGQGATDKLLTETAATLADEGMKLAGIVKELSYETHFDNGCDMKVRVLPEGPVIQITQNLGEGSAACRLDPSALEEAVARVENGDLSGAELFLLNKFGPQEAAGRGFVPVIGKALELGIPVLCGVGRASQEAFATFAGGLSETLDPAPDAVAAWCRDAQG